jgi:hypothetical protein
MKSPKFKVGDFVIPLPRKPGDVGKRPMYVSPMKDYVGLKCKVMHLLKKSDYYQYNLEGCGYWWHEDWLEKDVEEDFLKDEDLLI